MKFYCAKIMPLIVAIALVLCLSLAACSKKGVNSTTETELTSLSGTASATSTQAASSEKISGTEAPSSEKESEKTESESRGTEALSSENEPEKTESESQKSGVSKYYSQEDIDNAMDAVRGWMREAAEAGAKLKELYYPGDDFTDEYAKSGANAFKDTESSMVLGGYWIQSDGVERGTSGYPLWVWILGRDSDGGWSVKDAGY